MVETTLDRMAAGGMYDQVGGGFHRYSVDARWLVPHFEKMLYDNAMLARVYVLAYRAFGVADDARVARETLDYLLAEMTPEGGGFFAAQDADSGGEEGTFYVWNPRSLAEAVGEEAAPIVAARFGVTPAGNFEGGETVLSVVRSVAELATEFGRPEERDRADPPGGALAPLRRPRRPGAAGHRRQAPDRLDGARDLGLRPGRPRAVRAALRERRARSGGPDPAKRRARRELLHREKAGRADIPGFSTDYAFFIEALLDLYEATFEPRYFREAVRLQDVFETEFAGAGAAYYLAAAPHDGLIVRPAESYDGATPSSNSVAAMNLLRLAALHRRRRLPPPGRRGPFGLRRRSSKRPRPRSRGCSAPSTSATDAAREIVLAGSPGRGDFEALRAAVFASPKLNRVLAHAGSGLPELAPLSEGRGGEGPARAWVCENFACRAPVSDPAALTAALDA